MSMPSSSIEMNQATESQAQETQFRVQCMLARPTSCSSSSSSSSGEGPQQDFLMPLTVDFSASISNLSSLENSMEFFMGMIHQLPISPQCIQNIGVDMMAEDLHRRAMYNFRRGLDTTLSVFINPEPSPQARELQERVHRNMRERRARQSARRAAYGVISLPANGVISLPAYGVISLPATESQIARGLKRKTMEKEEEMQCSICLEEGENGMELEQMPCLHLFHGPCIRKWLRQSNCCPLCRGTIHPAIPHTLFTMWRVYPTCTRQSCSVDGWGGNLTATSCSPLCRGCSERTKEVEEMRRNTRFFKRHCISMFNINHNDNIC